MTTTDPTEALAALIQGHDTFGCGCCSSTPCENPACVDEDGFEEHWGEGCWMDEGRGMSLAHAILAAGWTPPSESSGEYAPSNLEYGVIITALMAGKISGPDALRAVLIQAENDTAKLRALLAATPAQPEPAAEPAAGSVTEYGVEVLADGLRGLADDPHARALVVKTYNEAGLANAAKALHALADALDAGTIPRPWTPIDTEGGQR